MSNQLYEFQFPVEKNKDYYVHAVDPSNVTNGRDEQGVHFYVDTTAYDATFVPEG